MRLRRSAVATFAVGAGPATVQRRTSSFPSEAVAGDGRHVQRAAPTARRCRVPCRPRCATSGSTTTLVPVPVSAVTSWSRSGPLPSSSSASSGPVMTSGSLVGDGDGLAGDAERRPGHRPVWAAERLFRHLRRLPKFVDLAMTRCPLPLLHRGAILRLGHLCRTATNRPSPARPRRRAAPGRSAWPRLAGCASPGAPWLSPAPAYRSWCLWWRNRAARVKCLSLPRNCYAQPLPLIPAVSAIVSCAPALVCCSRTRRQRPWIGHRPRPGAPEGAGKRTAPASVL